MRTIARRNAEDRLALFRNAAARLGMSAAIAEKDFWVCWLLDHLFHRCPWKDAFVFKGGTSLSKGFDLIKRFSEDIDLILDWRVLGYGPDEPWIERSNTKQDLFNAEANERAASFLSAEFLPKLRNDLSAELGTPAILRIDPDDPVFFPPGDMPARIRRYCAEHGQGGIPDDAALVRCIYDSLADCFKKRIGQLEAITGKTFDTVNILGGGTRDRFFMRLVAKTTGRRVLAGPAEATAIGNILAQMIACGALKNAAEARELVAKSFPLAVYG